MSNSIREQVVEALRDGNIYDFISNNYFRMSNHELAEIIKEMSFVAYTNLKEDEYRRYEKEVADSLVERDYL